MAPEYGANLGFFPVDNETLAYSTLLAPLTSTSLSSKPIARADALPHRTLRSCVQRQAELDLVSVDRPSPDPTPTGSRALKNAKASFVKVVEGASQSTSTSNNGDTFDLSSGAVVIGSHHQLHQTRRIHR